MASSATWSNNSQYRLQFADVGVSGLTISADLEVEKLSGSGYSGNDDDYDYGFSIAGQSRNGQWGPYNFTQYDKRTLRSASATVSGPGVYTIAAWAEAPFGSTGGMGRAPSSGTISITVTVATAPGKPGTPSASLTLPRTVALSWSAAAANQATILEYQVRYADNDDFGGASTVSAGTARSLALNVPSIGKTYWFAVRARNSKGWGDWSSARSVVVPNEPGAPGTPTASLTLPRTVALAWSAAAANNSAILEYQVRYADNSGFTGAQSTSAGTSRSKSVTVPSIGEVYWFAVRARNAQGWGAWSSARSVTVPGTPAKPAAPSISQLTATSMRVAWSAPSNGGNAITGYDVEVVRGGQAQTSSATASPLNLSNLTPSTAYSIRVRAKNQQGAGAWSDAASVTTLAGAYAPKDGVYVSTVAQAPKSGVYAAVEVQVPKNGVFVPAG